MDPPLRKKRMAKNKSKGKDHVYSAKHIRNLEKIKYNSIENNNGWQGQQGKAHVHN